MLIIRHIDINLTIPLAVICRWEKFNKFFETYLNNYEELNIKPFFTTNDYLLTHLIVLQNVIIT